MSKVWWRRNFKGSSDHASPPFRSTKPAVEKGREIDAFDLLLPDESDGGEILDGMDLELVDFAAPRSPRRVVVLLQPALARERDRTRQQLELRGDAPQPGGNGVSPLTGLGRFGEILLGFGRDFQFVVEPFAQGHPRQRRGFAIRAIVLSASAAAQGLAEDLQGVGPFLVQGGENGFADRGRQFVEIPRQRIAAEMPDRDSADEAAKDLGEAPFEAVPASRRSGTGPALEFGEHEPDAPLPIPYDLEIQRRESRDRGREPRHRPEEIEEAEDPARGGRDGNLPGPLQIGGERLAVEHRVGVEQLLAVAPPRKQPRDRPGIDPGGETHLLLESGELSRPYRRPLVDAQPRQPPPLAVEGEEDLLVRPRRGQLHDIARRVADEAVLGEFGVGREAVHGFPSISA